MTEKWWIFWIAAFWIVFLGPGVIEGKLFPVTDEVEGIIFTQNNENVNISGSVNKIRQCDPIKVEWFLGERDGPSVPIRFKWGPPTINLVGSFDFEGWTLFRINEYQARNNSYADVLHDCSVLGMTTPWDTRTRFYK